MTKETNEFFLKDVNKGVSHLPADDWQTELSNIELMKNV
jgi:hypothetical protein